MYTLPLKRTKNVITTHQSDQENLPIFAERFDHSSRSTQVVSLQLTKDLHPLAEVLQTEHN